MMDLDLSDLRLFEVVGADPYLARLTSHYPSAPEAIPSISREIFLAAVGTCRDRMEKFLEKCETAYQETAPGKIFNDRVGPPPVSLAYSIHTRKNDHSIDDVQRYALRDGIHYVTLWVGLRNDPLWLLIAKIVGFMTSLDDLVVRPGDIKDGFYQIGQESLDGLLESIRSLGGSRDVRWLEACREDVIFAGRIQFAEKWSACLDEDARAPRDVNVIDFYTEELNKNTLQASILRSHDTMAFGCLCLLSYYYNFPYQATEWSSFHASALCDGLGMDIGKDAIDIGVKDPTSFGDRPEADRATTTRRREQICTLFCQLTRYFCNAIDSPDAVYDRFARVALSYARLGDRYRERRTMTRFSLKGEVADLVQSLNVRMADIGSLPN